MFRKTFFFVLPIVLLAIGVGTFVYLVKTKPFPEGEVEADPGRLVRVFEARKTAHRVAVTAYGASRAGREWSAIAQVAGQAVEVHEKFEAGEGLKAGTVIARIDPTDYRIAVQRYRAEVKSKEHGLGEIGQKEKNLREIVKLQERRVALSKSELDRQQTLFEKGTATETDLEAAENGYVQQLLSLQESGNQLALIPIQKDLQEAALDLARAQLEQATTDLGKTEIELPFDARCSSKLVEITQYVPAGQSLGTFVSIDRAEVEAVLEPRQLRMLGFAVMGATQGFETDASGEIVPFWERIEIPAEVCWRLSDRDILWKGRVSRLASGLDAQTRTIQATIDVPDPFEGAVPGVRPPLLPGMFCEATILGATLENVVLVPRDALRAGRVYLAREGHLVVQDVEILATEEDIAVVGSGLENGDRVILTDLFPVVAGMPVREETVDNPASALLSRSRGETEIW
jgi:RND family efflux transporter MFP subunit